MFHRSLWALAAGCGAAMLSFAAAAQDLTLGLAGALTTLDPHAVGSQPNASVAAHIFDRLIFKDERLRKPWFKTRASVEEGVGTQDLYFWEDAKKYGYRCAVACDVQVGHYDADRDINW